VKPRLIVARKIPPAVAARVAREFDCPNPAGSDLDAEAALRQLAAHSAEALLFTSNIKLDAGTIARLPATLQIAATCSVGYKHIDVDAARTRGLVVTNTPDVLTECTAPTWPSCCCWRRRGGPANTRRSCTRAGGRASVLARCWAPGFGARRSASSAWAASGAPWRLGRAASA